MQMDKLGIEARWALLCAACRRDGVLSSAAVSQDILGAAEARLERGIPDLGILEKALEGAQSWTNADPLKAAEALRLAAKNRYAFGQQAIGDDLLQKALAAREKGSMEAAVLKLARAEVAGQNLDADAFKSLREGCDEALETFKSKNRSDLEVDTWLALAGLQLKQVGVTATQSEPVAEQAIEFAGKAKIASRGLNDKRREALAIFAEAVAYAWYGLFGDAITFANEAKTMFKELGLLSLLVTSSQCVMAWQLQMHEPQTDASQRSKELQRYCDVLDIWPKKADVIEVAAHCLLTAREFDSAFKLIVDSQAQMRRRTAASPATGNVDPDELKQQTPALSDIPTGQLKILLSEITMEKAKEQASAKPNDAKQFEELEARFLKLLMYAYFADDDPDEALRVAEETIAAYEKIGAGSSQAVMEVRQAKAQCHLQEFELEDAQKEVDWVLAAKNFPGDQKDRLLALQCNCFIKLEEGSVQSAQKIAADLRAEMDKADVQTSEVVSALMSTNVSMLQGELTWALASASSAVNVLHIMERKHEEAMACRMLTKMYMADKDLYAALQMAEKARWCCEAIGDQEQSVEALLLVAEVHMAIIVEDDLADDPKSDAFKSSMERALRAAESAKNRAARFGKPSLQALALCRIAQLHTLNQNFTEAVDAAVTAVKTFEAAEDTANAAAAKVILGDCQMASGNTGAADGSVDAAMQASRKEQDGAGVKFAEAAVAALKARKAAAQRVAAPGDLMPISGEGQIVVQASAGPTRSDISAKLKEIAVDVAGLDDDIIDFDRPLLEAGLTSQQAIILRNAMTKEIQGVNFPATLLFDFPTLGALAGMVYESSKDVPDFRI